MNQESGQEIVRTALGQGAVIGAVNLSEVVTKLMNRGASASEIRTELDGFGLDVIQFDAELAYRAGFLRPLTRQLGLSLGDRACLALAERLGVPVLTADRAWQGLQLGVTVRVIR
jgi:ribonuclease VapC